MSDFDAAKKRLEEAPPWHAEDVRLLLAEVERLQTLYEGAVHDWRNACELMNKAEAEVERLREELTGQRAIERSRMRRFALSLQANIACPCGQVLQAVEQLEGHLDHMCNDESWRKAAALRGEGEK